MNLTPSQLTTLRSAIIADVNLAAARAARSTQAIADYLNQLSTTQVWRTSVETKVLFDQITWANMTPNDPPDGSLGWQCRALACQGKQFNLQLIFGSRDTIDPSKTNVRAGLQDALTNVPSGTGGAVVSAGWVNVRTAMQRTATNFENIFATPGSPSSLVVEGVIDEFTIRQLAWANDGNWML